MSLQAKAHIFEDINICDKNKFRSLQGK